MWCLCFQEQAACHVTVPVVTEVPKCFKVGMKLEAKDRKNPTLTCVVTINKINKKGALLIHFDGWSTTFGYWCTPDSPDIHPVGWCDENDMTLQAPNGKKLLLL